MNLELNSKVFYPSHGAGWVRSKRIIEFGGEKKKYLEFEFVNNAISISTPIEKLDELNIRPLESSCTIVRHIKLLKQHPTLKPPAKDYMERMDIIKNLNEHGYFEDHIKIVQYCNYIKLRREKENRTIPVQVRSYIKKSIEYIIGELAVSCDVQYDAAKERFSKLSGLL